MRLAAFGIFSVPCCVYRSGITRRIPPLRNELWIEIYDNGIVIPGDRIDTIFGELHQFDPRREGLG